MSRRHGLTCECTDCAFASNDCIEIYWRIYDHPTDGPIVVCMQWFDEGDYDQARFWSPEDCRPTRFDTEAEAKAYLDGAA